jgi:hypothetical protein
MKPKSSLFVMLLLTSLLASACYGTNKNPKLIDLPKYLPVALTGVSLDGIQEPSPQSCSVHAIDLLGAWVSAGSPEKDPFTFSDVGGKNCEGTFAADISPLFSRPNLWYPGGLSCTSCHSQDVTTSYARMDLSSYQGILAGSGRASADAKGEDILGGGNWEAAKLHEVLSKGEMPPNQTSAPLPLGPLVYAGKVK